MDDPGSISLLHPHDRESNSLLYFFRRFGGVKHWVEDMRMEKRKDFTLLLLLSILISHDAVISNVMPNT